jgi:hypothetical protein
VEKYDGARLVTDYNIIRRMRFTCWISKVAHARTHTHTIFNTSCLSTQQWFRERASVYVIRTLPVLFTNSAGASFVL